MESTEFLDSSTFHISMPILNRLNMVSNFPTSSIVKITFKEQTVSLGRTSLVFFVPFHKSECIFLAVRER